ncbi:MAG: DsbA family protein [Cellulomonadaceae bacterium]|nr:DsbA family protein [Cellulomonadaceae bacterium]
MTSTSQQPAATPADQTRATADFWFDPLCPWAWLTSRWMTEVEQVREVDVRWHVMSLAILNDVPDHDEPGRRAADGAWGPVRVVAAAQRAHGDAVVKPLYDAIGARLHPGGRSDRAAVLVEALAEVGLPAELADAAGSSAHDDLVRASHAGAIERVGNDVGTPVVGLAGGAFFGPVMTPAPRGEEAGRLWDGLALITSVPGVYEIKRGRTAGPVFD